MDVVRIEGLETRCIVGVRPSERVTKQGVVVDLALGVDTSRAAGTGRIAHTVDYALVVDQVTALLSFRRYGLIEAATEELAALLFAAHPALAEIEIRLAKPSALSGRARSASVEIRRVRANFPARVERHPFGSLEVLLETTEARIALASIAPGASVPTEVLSSARRLDCVLDGQVTVGARTLVPGQLATFERDAPGYANQSTASVRLSTCAAFTAAVE